MMTLEVLIDFLVSLEMAIVGFLIGWTMPRGKRLKTLQLRALRVLTKWLR